MRSSSNRRRDEILYSALALISGGLLCVWGGLNPAEAEPAPAEESAPVAQPPAPDGGAPAAPAALPASVRIIFTTLPPTKAMVLWGKKHLGLIEPRKPLIVQRPRDSGPLDLMVRAEGFLPVQTRVYTFADGKIAVKLTPPDQKKTLLGYREPPPPDAGSQSGGGSADGGTADPPP